MPCLRAILTNSGEWMKGMLIVLAEMGLVSYSGRVVRTPDLFEGIGAKARRPGVRRFRSREREENLVSDEADCPRGEALDDLLRDGDALRQVPRSRGAPAQRRNRTVLTLRAPLQNLPFVRQEVSCPRTNPGGEEPCVVDCADSRGER